MAGPLGSAIRMLTHIRVDSSPEPASARLPVEGCRASMPGGVTVAQGTLNPLVQVRILAWQPRSLEARPLLVVHTVPVVMQAIVVSETTVDCARRWLARRRRRAPIEAGRTVADVVNPVATVCAAAAWIRRGATVRRVVPGQTVNLGRGRHRGRHPGRLLRFRERSRPAWNQRGWLEQVARRVYSTGPSSPSATQGDRTRLSRSSSSELPIPHDQRQRVAGLCRAAYGATHHATPRRLDDRLPRLPHLD